MEDRRYALFKRTLEYYEADAAFRDAMTEDPGGSVGYLGLPRTDGKEICAAILAILGGRAAEEAGNPYVAAWRARISPQVSFATAAVDAARFGNTDIAEYVNITLSRARMESGHIARNPQIRFVPAAFELSDGCKVQCPFCGLAAKGWNEDFPYEEKRALWQGILRGTSGLLGEVADQAPLYFATEPFDHMRYEDFIRDVEALGGYIPQTTTAVPERDIRRTKAFMAFLGNERLRTQARLRFSIRTLAQFRKIMDAFSPEELTGVELIINNPESVHLISETGRVRGAVYGKRMRAAYSISCLCGVLVRLCDGTMTFMEPEKPDEQSPLGIRIRGEWQFTDETSFAAGLRELYRMYAIPVPTEEQPLTLNRHVRVIREETRILLAGGGSGYYLERNPYTDRMTELLEAEESGISIRELANRLCLGITEKDALMERIVVLYRKGYLHTGNGGSDNEVDSGRIGRAVP